MQGIQSGGTEDVIQGKPTDGNGLYSLLKQLN
jgi:hypothetical protein